MRAERVSRRWTQEKLSAELKRFEADVRQDALSRFEKSSALPSWLVRALDEVFGGDAWRALATTASERQPDRVSDSLDEAVVYLKDVSVVGVASAETFAFNFDDPPIDSLPIVVARSSTRRYAAFRVRGECMEPEYHDGEFVVVAETENVPDGEPGVFRLDGGCTLKIPFRRPDGVELRPLNPKFKSKVYSTNKLEVVGIVIGTWRKRRPL